MDVDPLITSASGSLGQDVHTRNQHGPYVKPRVTPADPATARQLSLRAHLATCCLAWNNTLTQAQRSAWDRYALAVRLSGALGRRNNVAGVAMYVRSNMSRLQANEVTLPRVDVAPTLFDLGPFSPIPRVVLNVIDDTFHPFFAESDAWTTQTGAAMLFYASAPRPLTVNFWKGPYRYMGPLLGSDPTLSSPATVALPQPATVTQRVFIRARVTQADGRLSVSLRLPADIVPQVAPLYTGAVFTDLGGGRFQLVVSFDNLIRRQVHASGSWLWRYQNYLYYPNTAITDRDTIVLVARNIGPLNPGIDVVDYNPVVPDVYGLLTGIAVPGFTQPF